MQKYRFCKFCNQEFRRPDKGQEEIPFPVRGMFPHPHLLGVAHYKRCPWCKGLLEMKIDFLPRIFEYFPEGTYLPLSGTILLKECYGSWKFEGIGRKLDNDTVLIEGKILRRELVCSKKNCTRHHYRQGEHFVLRCYHAPSGAWVEA